MVKAISFKVSKKSILSRATAAQITQMPYCVRCDIMSSGVLYYYYSDIIIIFYSGGLNYVCFILCLKGSHKTSILNFY